MKHAFTTALALLLAPMAQGQEICSRISEITSAAPDDFKPIWGGWDEDDYVPTSVWLEDGAGNCAIELTDKPYYYCGWNLDTLTQAEAEYASLKSEVRQCLAGWRESDAVGKISFGGLTMVEGVHFDSPPGKDADTIVTVYFKQSVDWYSLKFEVGRR